MLTIPTCMYSKCKCDRFCIHFKCTKPAFICKYCPEQKCQDLHVHDSKTQFVNLKSFTPLFELNFRALENKKLKSIEKIEEETKKFIEAITLYLQTKIQAVQQVYKRFKIPSELKRTTDKFENKAFKNISGRQMRKIYTALEELQYVSNLQELQLEAEAITETVKSFYDQTKNLITQNRMQRRPTHPRRQIKKVRFNHEKINIEEIFLKDCDEVLNFQLSDSELCSQIIPKVTEDMMDHVVEDIMIQDDQNNPQPHHQLQNQMHMKISGIIKSINLFEQATQFQSKGDLIKSKQSYTKVTELNPQNFQAFNNRGVIYDEIGQIQLAFRDYNQSILLNPQFATAYNNRGQLFHCLLRYSEAEQDYNKAILTNPNYLQVYLNRGILCEDRLDFENAKMNYDEAVRIYSCIQKTPLEQEVIKQIYERRAQIQFLKERFEESIKDYDRALEIQQTDPQCHYNKAIIYARMMKYEEASQSFRMALQYNPRMREVYFSRALLYQSQNKTEQALQDYTKCIQIDPQNYEAYNNRGLLYNLLKNYKQAQNDFTQAILIKNNGLEAHVNRGILYKTTGRLQLAHQDFDKSIQIQQNCFEAIFQKAIINYDKKNYKNSIQDLHKAISINPNNWQSYFYRAMIHENMKCYKQAEQDYSSCIALNPTYTIALSRRGKMYNSLNRFESALIDFTKCIQQEPKNKTNYLNRALVHRILGQMKQAERDEKMAMLMKK